MGSNFQKVAIVGRHDDPRVAEPMTQLVNHLTKTGVDVFAAQENKLDLPLNRVAEDELPELADLMIAVGGDGTMLYAGSLARQSDIPLLGINRGRLGFLADVTPDEMLASVDHILNGEYTARWKQEWLSTTSFSNAAKQDAWSILKRASRVSSSTHTPGTA
jgi:NAD+ kinase